MPSTALSESVSLLRDLVALPSVNPMGRAMQSPNLYEHRVTDYLEGFFKSLGVRYERQPVAPQRENIVAYLDGSDGRTFVWEAHMDTVPTDNMTIDPFGSRIEGGRLYGRGACDIKGGMASMLGAFARLSREKPRGGAGIVMACTVDEEFTFLGVQRLVKGLKADGAIVAEPTKLQIVKAHKGVVRWSIVATGRSCHSSAPEKGINAIYRMGRLLVAIEEFAEELRLKRTDPLLGPPTLSVGMIEGGTSVNTVPNRCRIEIDRRLIPGEDPQTVPAELEEFLRDRANIEFPYETEPAWLGAPALPPDGSDKLIAELGEAIKTVQGSYEVTAVPYGTDAASIAEVGIPAIVFGPGDIAQAHTCDEWVALEQIEQASEILYRFARG
jgi:acetylornithine deacetylase ArgE